MLADPGPAEETGETLPDVEETYHSLRRRFIRHHARFFLARGWKDALKWRLSITLGTDWAEGLLAWLRAIKHWK